MEFDSIQSAILVPHGDHNTKVCKVHTALCCMGAVYNSNIVPTPTSIKVSLLFRHHGMWISTRLCL
jgi:hypothetical protein